jgi:hypothetical protein
MKCGIIKRKKRARKGHLFPVFSKIKQKSGGIQSEDSATLDANHCRTKGKKRAVNQFFHKKSVRKDNTLWQDTHKSATDACGAKQKKAADWEQPAAKGEH